MKKPKPSAAKKRSTLDRNPSAAKLVSGAFKPDDDAFTFRGVVADKMVMGEIKVQLTAGAAADAAPADTTATSEPALQDLQARMLRIERLLTAAQPAPVATAAPALPDEQPASLEALTAAPAEPDLPDVAPAPEPVAAAAVPEWRDEVSFTLAPGQGAEFKLAMEEGAAS